MNQPKQLFPIDDEPEDATIATSNAHAIIECKVTGLFGRYDYSWSMNQLDADVTRLILLYGENGAGKTTLLSLIYHALSPEENAGHRSYIAKTRFSLLELGLNDGTRLTIENHHASKNKTLTLSLTHSSKTLAHCTIPVTEDLSIKSAHFSRDVEAKWQRFMAELSHLRMRLHYLPCDRRQQDDNSWQHIAPSTRQPQILSESMSLQAMQEVLKFSARQADDPDHTLKSTLQKVKQWVQSEVRMASTRGQGDVYSIYSKVIRDLAHHERATPASRESIIERVGRLSNTSELYSRYGLTPHFPAEELLSSVRDTSEYNMQALYNVITPYLDGIEARHDALSAIYKRVDTLVRTLNSSFQDKQVDVNLDKGVVITAGGTTLSPTLLSSGEKQLLMLLCSTALARRHATIFLIDEPEISLNIRWQRSLVSSLLDNASNSNVQFIMATHSLEILSGHRENVIPLENTRISGSDT